MAAENQNADFISRVRAAADRIRMAEEFAADVLSESIAIAGLDRIAETGDPVFESGQHAGLTKADIVNAIGTIAAFGAFYDVHKTNLHQVRN